MSITSVWNRLIRLIAVARLSLTYGISELKTLSRSRRVVRPSRICCEVTCRKSTNSWSATVAALTVMAWGWSASTQVMLTLASARSMAASKPGITAWTPKVPAKTKSGSPPGDPFTVTSNRVSGSSG